MTALPLKQAAEDEIERFERSIVAGINGAAEVEPARWVYAEQASDFRLTRLAHAAFQLGLIHGRAIVRPITREHLVERLGLVIVERRAPRSPFEVTFDQVNALRVTYGAAHRTSAAGRRR